MYMGTSLIRNGNPPLDHLMILGIVLLSGPRRGVFRMGEETLSDGLVTSGVAAGATYQPLGVAIAHVRAKVDEFEPRTRHAK